MKDNTMKYVKPAGWAIVLFVIIFGGMFAAAQESAYRTVDHIDYYDGLTFSKENSNADDAYRRERCRLDLYLPLAESYPTVVWFHGGGLTGGEKHIPDGFRQKGIGVVAVNYRLSSERAKCPDYLVDAAAAVAWTLENIERYGGDAQRVYVSGHSAGGYLSAMVTLDPTWLRFFGHSNLELAAAFPVSGQMTTHFQILNERRGYDVTPSNPAEIDPFAPLHFTTAKVPPIYLLVGDSTLEWPGRVEENGLLAAMLKIPAEHGMVEFRSFPLTDHGSVLSPSIDFIVQKLTDRRDSEPEKTPNALE